MFISINERKFDCIKTVMIYNLLVIKTTRTMIKYKILQIEFNNLKILLYKSLMNFKRYNFKKSLKFYSNKTIDKTTLYYLIQGRKRTLKANIESLNLT